MGLGRLIKKSRLAEEIHRGGEFVASLMYKFRLPLSQFHCYFFGVGRMIGAVGSNWRVCILRVMSFGATCDYWGSSSVVGYTPQCTFIINFHFPSNPTSKLLSQESLKLVTKIKV